MIVNRELKLAQRRVDTTKNQVITHIRVTWLYSRHCSQGQTLII